MNQILNKIYKYFILRTANRMPKNRFGDLIHSTALFYIHHNRLPNDSNSFNDVLFRLKTSDEILDPLRIFVTDKEHVKLYVKAIVGDQYNVPTIDVIRDKNMISEYRFPPDCCIKPTHTSTHVIIRRNNDVVDINEIKSWFEINYYKWTREANYKYLQPKVIIEPIIFGATSLNDYKFLCLNGRVKLIQVDVDRTGDHRRKLLDRDWNALPCSMKIPMLESTPVRPDNLDEMIDVAEKLSARFNFIRVDLYSNGRQCLVGEITNCHANAHAKFIPPSCEKVISDLIWG